MIQENTEKGMKYWTAQQQQLRSIEELNAGFFQNHKNTSASTVSKLQ